MMTHQAGVRTIVAGGQPVPGPMQAASGTRGARAYSAAQLDHDFEDAIKYSDGAVTSELSLLNAKTDPRDSGMFIRYLGFNLRDQIRAANDRGGVNGPLQFAYLAADCRIYYTLDSVLDVSILWHDAARALWVDQERCVHGSTGYSVPAGSDGPARSPPASNATSAWYPSSLGDNNQASNDTSEGGINDDTSPTARAQVRQCGPNLPSCNSPTTECLSAKYSCNGYSEPISKSLCLPLCDTNGQGCWLGLTCVFDHPVLSEGGICAGQKSKGKANDHEGSKWEMYTNVWGGI